MNSSDIFLNRMNNDLVYETAEIMTNARHKPAYPNVLSGQQPKKKEEGLIYNGIKTEQFRLICEAVTN